MSYDKKCFIVLLKYNKALYAKKTHLFFIMNIPHMITVVADIC